MAKFFLKSEIESANDDFYFLKNKGIFKKNSCKIEIGMCADELLRFKQISGLASLFSNKDFSKSWEISKN